MGTSMKTHNTILLTLLILFSHSALAKKDTDTKSKKDTKTKAETEATDILKSLDYPELQVVPRASERIRMEAKAEARNWWYVHWPMQLSAISTIGAGLFASSNQADDLSDVRKEEAKTASSAAIALGSAWLLETLISRAELSSDSSASLSRRSAFLLLFPGCFLIFLSARL